MTGICLQCGREGPVDLDHLTGRRCRDGEYLDDGLTIPLCRACHAAAHVARRRLGIEWPQVDFLAHRLRRVGAFSTGLAADGRGFALASRSTGALVGLLIAGADAIEREVVEQAS